MRSTRRLKRLNNSWGARAASGRPARTGSRRGTRRDPASALLGSTPCESGPNHTATPRARRPGPPKRPPRERIPASAQRKDWPAARLGDAAKRLVGIDRDRPRHALEQRQVVVRVAVEPAPLKARERLADPGQPLLDPRDLAVAEARDARDFPGEAAGADLGLGRDEMRDAELARDRRRDERVGRGDDRAERARVAVPRYELARAGADHRSDLGVHERGVPGVELPARMARERNELEIEELVDIERAGLVLAEELVVLRLVALAVEHAALDQELRPLVIAVTGEKRVVEVEERELHAAC